MSQGKTTTVAALADGLRLFKLLAEDFQPRTLKQIIELAAQKGHEWSQTKVFDMLNTLASEQFVRKSANGEWAIAPQVTAVSASFHQFVSQRSQALLAEVAEVQSLTERKQ